MFKKLIFYIYCISFVICIKAQAQLKWTNVDSLYQPLPSSIHVFKSTDPIEGKPNIAYYVIADLKDKGLIFTSDTTKGRRLTPKEFYEKDDKSLIVVNTTFFSFETNQNLNTVINEGKVVSHNKSVAGTGKDSLLFLHTLNSVLGISKKGRADIAWIFSDSSEKYTYALQKPVKSIKTSNPLLTKKDLKLFLADTAYVEKPVALQKWKMRTAIGGGPVLLQEGKILITNNEERKFGGKAIADKHPRTAMGYTKDDKLIILVIQGRTPQIAEGASLLQEAAILQSLGCLEALNLDGGGSSCLLINGKETIDPSDKKQRAVPAVFIIQERKN